MPESEWAAAMAAVERDPDFRNLVASSESGRPIVRNKPSSAAAFEFADTLPAASPTDPIEIEELRGAAFATIEKIGRHNFESAFIFRTAPATPALTAAERQRLEEFVLEESIRAASPEAPLTVMGRIVRRENGRFALACHSPLIARGLYELDNAAVRRWLRAKELDRDAVRRLNGHLGLIDLVNLKHGAFWRLVEVLLEANRVYFETGDPARVSPLSLRKVAARLGFAPSTVSRIANGKSVVLPWGTEAPLISLMPGQRTVILSALEKLLATNARWTDAALAERLAKDFDVRVSRRTVSACRTLVIQRLPAQNAA
ncbi:MAG: hypothetical protein JO102_05820 [Elusimicrobia bacterium]|nr:hypothetical protein [Elusimicrobiota bacterium]